MQMANLERTIMNIEWIMLINTLVLIIASTFRSWNLGFTKESYLVSGICQIPLVIESIRSKNLNRIVLNIFYLCNSIIAVTRW